MKEAINKIIGKKVKFFEDTHCYKLFNLEGEFEKNLISSTSFISKFFPSFEKEKNAKAIAKRDKKDVQEILNEWSTTSKKASDFGTKVHLFAEMYVQEKYSQLPFAESPKEKKYFEHIKKYVSQFREKGWKLEEAEKLIFNENLGGLVDLILVNHKRKEYSIEDWKTNKSIDTISFSGNEFGFFPIDFLQNCSYNKYMLQMALYSRIIKKGKFLKEDYSIKNKLIHLTSSGIDFYRPKMDFENYTKLMEQKYFNVRIR